MDDDKKQLFSQILLAIAVFCVLVVLLISIIYHVQDALIDRNVFCSNITNETYDITPDHEWCKLNETTVAVISQMKPMT